MTNRQSLEVQGQLQVGENLNYSIRALRLITILAKKVDYRSQALSTPYRFYQQIISLPIIPSFRLW